MLFFINEAANAALQVIISNDLVFIFLDIQGTYSLHCEKSTSAS
jgi:hypothetical protein